MECYAYLRNVTELLSDGKTPYERRFGQPFEGLIIPFGSLVEYCPITAKDQSRIHQFGKKVLLGLFLGTSQSSSTWHAHIARVLVCVDALFSENCALAAGCHPRGSVVGERWGTLPQFSQLSFLLRPTPLNTQQLAGASPAWTATSPLGLSRALARPSRGLPDLEPHAQTAWPARTFVPSRGLPDLEPQLHTQHDRTNL